MKIHRFLALFVGVLLTACGGFNAGVEPLTTPTAALIQQIPSSTATMAILPINTASPTATITVPPPTPIPPTAAQVPPTSPPTEQAVKIFLIVLEDNGQSGTLVGCGDSAVPITVFIPPTQGVLKAALEKMLSAKQQFYGESGYYNALYQSNLQLESVTIEQGKAIIHLTGTVMLGGVCDAPRVEAQIEQTALQFSTVTDVAIFINDIPLDEVLSLK